MVTLRRPVEPDAWFRRGFGDGHRGDDWGWLYAAPARTQRVYAAAPGRVVSTYTRASRDNGGDNLGWGNQVVIEHAPNVYTTYNHFAPGAVAVRVGQQVDAGHYLGQMGNTGRSEGPHLHHELRIGGMGSQHRVDPAPYYSKHLPGTASPASKGDYKPFPSPSPAVAPEEEEEMMAPRQIHYTDSEGAVIRALLVPGTGYFVKWTEGQATYANAIAKNMGTGSSTAVTASLFAVFEREALAMRPKDALSIEIATIKD